MIKSKSIMAVMLCLAVVALFLNCKNDNSPTSAQESGLVGTWKLSKMTIGTLIFDDLETIGFAVTLELKSDGTFRSTEVDEGLTTVETGTWSVSGNTLLLTENNETISATYVLAGNKLTVTMTEEGQPLILEFIKQ